MNFYNDFSEESFKDSSSLLFKATDRSIRMEAWSAMGLLGASSPLPHYFLMAAQFPNLCAVLLNRFANFLNEIFYQLFQEAWAKTYCLSEKNLYHSASWLKKFKRIAINSQEGFFIRIAQFMQVHYPNANYSLKLLPNEVELSHNIFLKPCGLRLGDNSYLGRTITVHNQQITLQVTSMSVTEWDSFTKPYSELKKKLGPVMATMCFKVVTNVLSEAPKSINGGLRLGKIVLGKGKAKAFLA